MFTGIAIDDKLAYPLYTAACDEGAVVTINVGVPGPMKPAKLQRTILDRRGRPGLPRPEARDDPPRRPLDQRDGRDAGQAPERLRDDGRAGRRSTCPRRSSTSLRRRNKTKLMWSSDYPILPFDRTITEGRAIELPEDSRANFLGANALAVFGDPAQPDLASHRQKEQDNGTSRRTRRHHHRCRAAGSVASTRSSSPGRERASWSTTSARWTTSSAEIKELGGQAVGNNDDVSDWDGAGRLVQTALDTFGELHVLVNNAGILRDKMFVNMDVGMWDDVDAGSPARHLLPDPARRRPTGGRSTRRARRCRTRGSSTRPRRRASTAMWARSNYGAAKAAIAGVHGDPCRRARPAGHHRQRDRAERADPDDRRPRRLRHEDGGDQGAHRVRRGLARQHRPDRGVAGHRGGRRTSPAGSSTSRAARSVSPRPGSPGRRRRSEERWDPAELGAVDPGPAREGAAELRRLGQSAERAVTASTGSASNATDTSRPSGSTGPSGATAFISAMQIELHRQLELLDADADVRAIVVTGRGRFFSTGADLEPGGANFAFDEEQTARARKMMADRPRPWQMRTPIIAAMNGSAVGIGLTFPLQWDIRIVNESAKYGFVFTRRGLIPEQNSLWLLPRLVGLSVGPRAAADRAAVHAAPRRKELGIATRAVPGGRRTPAPRSQSPRRSPAQAAPAAVGPDQAARLRAARRDRPGGGVPSRVGAVPVDGSPARLGGGRGVVRREAAPEVPVRQARRAASDRELWAALDD